MTAFLALESELLPEAPGADVIVIERSVRRAVREFCEKTLVLETTTNPYLDIEANVPEYTLPAVEDREIVRIKRGGVWWGTERQLHATSEDQLDREQGDPRAYLMPDSQNVLGSTAILRLSDPWRAMKDATPVYFYQPRSDSIRLVPIPNTAYEAKLGVTYHLKPSFRATEVDDHVIADWYETIVFGALAELLGIPKKPWTDLVMSMDLRKKFESGIQGVVADRISGFASNDYAVGRVRAYP